MRTEPPLLAPAARHSHGPGPERGRGWMAPLPSPPVPVLGTREALGERGRAPRRAGLVTGNLSKPAMQLLGPPAQTRGGRATSTHSAAASSDKEHESGSAPRSPGPAKPLPQARCSFGVIPLPAQRGRMVLGRWEAWEAARPARRTSCSQAVGRDRAIPRKAP